MKKTFYATPEGVDALCLYDRAQQAQRQGGCALHIVGDDHRVAALKEHCAFFTPQLDVMTFPAWDCLPYDRVSPNLTLMGERIAVLNQLLARQKTDIRKPLLLVATHHAVTQRVLPASVIEGHAAFLEKGTRYDPDLLSNMLVGQGYGRVQTVREPGEFAIRGGLMDVWPTGQEQPARLDFFGDEIESLRAFDALTQRSEGRIDSLSLFPAGEIILSEENISRFRQAYRAQFGAMTKAHPIYDAISEGRRLAGAEHFLPLFYDKMASLLDYCPGAILSVDDTVPTAAQERLEQIDDYYDTRLTLDQQGGKGKPPPYNPLPADALYFSEGEWHAVLSGADCLSPYADPTLEEEGAVKRARDFTAVRVQPDADLIAALVDYFKVEGRDRHCLLALYGHGARERVKAMLEAKDITGLRLCDTLDDVHRLKNGTIGLAVIGLTHGFINDKYCIVSEQDFLGDRLTRRASQRKAKKQADAFIQDISALNQGDLIVHDEHGIGRFDGLETVNAVGTLHDCLRLVYDGGDRLFVPVEHIEVLSRFGGEEGTVALDKLGGAGWQARKSKVKQDLLAMAGQLLDIAAARMMQKADIYNPDAATLAEFASGFPYAETQDQAAAITGVMDDLQAGRPMDRLVCGDVGFGKTEIALRAGHAVACEGAQVAVIVPTTLLARQHAANFIQRFERTGLTVGHLSRLVSAADAKKTKEGLANGTVNVVIGTHALLSEKIDFSNLGLVIVDEEQRFGVKQKERLKDLRKNVHVLTLTATPIPRTLQMALTGVRDLSLITTPPVDRLAIRSFVMPYDPFVIREALLREHHRGGQSFVVCPRVKDIEMMLERLQEIAPELRVIAAHGQLTTQDLEARMQAFIDRDVDVLLATNIIESGLDIPAANTMIIHRADMFGLSQLYQIRGRIGRGKTRAYAYLTFEGDAKISDTAMKRLDVMGTLDQLGSGFQLASHDMDIRGAGNLLGEQQSGHIREVGVELYQQMLEEAVANVREGREGKTVESVDAGFVPQINLGTSVLIPESYVQDLQVRINLYRRIGALVDEGEGEALAAEMIDRFGPLPDEVENLLSITVIKHLCRQAGVGSVESGPKGAVIAFHNNCPPKPEAIMHYVANKVGTVKLRPADQKLVYLRQWSSRAQRVNGTRQILQELATLAA